MNLTDYVDSLASDLRAANDELRRLRDKRVGHHIAAHGGQTVGISAGFTLQQSGDHDLLVSVGVKTELYDLDLLEKLERLSGELRAMVGKRVDELRMQIATAMAEDPRAVNDCLESGRPWPPGTVP